MDPIVRFQFIFWRYVFQNLASSSDIYKQTIKTKGKTRPKKCRCFGIGPKAYLFCQSRIGSLGSLSYDDGNGNENVTRKYIFISFVLLRDYFNSLNFYRNGELSRNQIGRSGVQVKKENEKFTVVFSRSPKNREFGHSTLLGSLSNDDGNGNENVTRKYIFISFVLLRDYFNSLNFYENCELSRNQIGGSGVQVKKENEKFTTVRSRSPQNLKWGHFTLLFCRGRQRNVPKIKTHVQSDCFCSLNLLFCGVVVAVAVIVA